MSEAKTLEKHGVSARFPGFAADEEKGERGDLNPQPAQSKSKTAQELAPTAESPLALSLARESQNDADLASLLALWPALPEAGRRLLVTTAQTLAGTLTRKRAKRKP